MRNFISIMFVVLTALFLSVLAFADPATVPVVVAGSDTIANILAKLPDWLQLASVVIAAASSISALFPMPKVDGVLLLLRKIVDFLALNFGGAKNASDSKTNKYIN